MVKLAVGALLKTGGFEGSKEEVNEGVILKHEEAPAIDVFPLGQDKQVLDLVLSL